MSTERKKGIYERYIKRPQDVLCALLGLILLSPVFAIVAFMVGMKLGRPVLFRQYRPGKDEKIFALYKFRTMTDARDESGNLLPDEARLSPFGKWLRSTSLDELPELFNILKGEMSVVGPRPQLIRDMVFMTDGQRARHTVRPGLTGLAQIHGRNGIGWEKKFAWDLTYISHITFLTDWNIILETLVCVIQKKGIQAEGMETSEDYGDYLLANRRINKAEYDKKIADAKKRSNEVR